MSESKSRPLQVTMSDAKRRGAQGTSFFAILDSDEAPPHHQTQTSTSENAALLRVYCIPTGVPLREFGLANPRSDFVMRRRHHDMEMHKSLQLDELCIRECEKVAFS